jgi:hypothetical protein
VRDGQPLTLCGSEILGRPNQPLTRLPQYLEFVLAGEMAEQHGPLVRREQAAHVHGSSEDPGDKLGEQRKGPGVFRINVQRRP